MKLIKMSASWCVPCKQLSKLMQEVTIPYEVKEVDIDADPSTAIKFGVRGVPTLLLVEDDGETVVKRANGALTKAKLEEFLTPPKT